MNELATLPASIRQRLEQAQSLAQQGHHGQAQDFSSQALVELARADPYLFALIMAKRAGLNGIAFTETVERNWNERVEHKFFGITYQTEDIPRFERRVTTKTVSFF